MANEIDMWQDIARIKRKKQKELLCACYQARYIDGELEKAEKLKEEFITTFGFWNNWY